MNYTVEAKLLELPVRAPEVVLTEYGHLASLNTPNSYFVSYGWMAAWLAELPIGCRVYKVIVRQGETPVAVFFLGMAKIRRSKLFKIYQLVLNASGNSEYDRLYIEYNSIVSLANFNMDFLKLLDDISLYCNEIMLPGLDLAAYPGKAMSFNPVLDRYIEDATYNSYFVDLKKVRHEDGGYLSLLSSNSRSQIRRSFRVLEQSGPVQLEVPADLDQAFSVYHEMVALHAKSWASRGIPGAFAADAVCSFHERLIRNQYDKGEIQLLRIRAGETTVGCLYSFIWKGKVYFYQSGINYDFGKKVQPGLVSHVLAVQHNAEQGYDTYDFLAGEERYKKSLATNQNTLSWARVQRPSLKLKLEDALRAIHKRLQSKGVIDVR